MIERAEKVTEFRVIELPKKAEETRTTKPKVVELAEKTVEVEKSARAKVVELPRMTEYGVLRKSDLELMTREYFYPDFFREDITSVEIPSIDRLMFLGVSNLSSVWGYASQGYTKLSRRQKELRKDLVRIKNIAAKVVREKIVFGDCDRSETAACRFGRDIAEWCGRCTENGGQSGKTCIFANCSQEVVENCKQFLQDRLNLAQEQFSFVDQYMYNVSKASARTGTGMLNAWMPAFSLTSADHICIWNDRARIVEIRSDGEIRRGIFVHHAHDHERRISLSVLETDEAMFLTDDGQRLEIRLEPREENGTLYMLEEDFVFLAERPEIRQFWMQMTCGATTAGIAKAFEKIE